MKKHKISLILAMLMVLCTFFSLFSVSAFAYEGGETISSVEATDGFEVSDQGERDDVGNYASAPLKETAAQLPTEPESEGDLLGTVNYAMELVAEEIIEASTPRTVLSFILASLLCALLLVCLVIYTVLSSFKRRFRAMRERRAARRAQTAQP